MRINLILAGGVILALGYLLSLSGDPNLVVVVPVGLLNILLGVITARNQGVTQSADPSDPVKLYVDKGVVGSNTYELVFLKEKLVLKKLNSFSLTLLVPLMLTIVGFALLFVLGALMFGLTGVSLQEFVTQRRRERISKENRLTTTDPGDLEIRYDEIEKVEISRSRLYMFLRDRMLRINISRAYSKKIRALLGQIISSKVQTAV